MKRILIILLLIFVLFISCNQYIIEKEYIVISLGKDKTTNGVFILGCGSIDSEFYYVGFIQEDNYIRHFKIKVESTYIIEDEKLKENGILKVSCNYYSNNKYNEKSENTYKDIYLSIENLENLNSKKYLYLPKGSIIREIKL